MRWIRRPVLQRRRREETRIEPLHLARRRHRRQVGGPLMLALGTVAEGAEDEHQGDQRRDGSEHQQCGLAALGGPAPRR